ncbi:hypothetical protein KIN20_011095 [Parelaphostrongylus tenuis]|uniref:Uncharacterized protein n=1 Tax=Parelaphostrongylus tenuis TaxID=148309 RepID=A0AAD5QM82_PARTN|nr:hypothetical protein KIN20_011095 [Parelaphostrongylus tenuis]
MEPYNETLRTGCDTQQYTWCDTSYGTSPIILLATITTLLGVVVTLAEISLDTIYSKVLGQIDQSIMQGAMVVVDDISRICTPTYST